VCYPLPRLKFLQILLITAVFRADLAPKKDRLDIEFPFQPKAMPPAFPSAQQGGMTKKQRDRSMGKILAEFTRLRVTSMVSGHPLLIIKDSSLFVDLSATQTSIQELSDTCKIDGNPLQEEAVTVKILKALTQAV